MSAVFTLTALTSSFFFFKQKTAYEILFPQRFVERHALIFVLRRQGTAAEQVARSAASRISRDPFPEHVQNAGVPVFLMDTSPAQFKNLSADCFERSEVEEFLTVVAVC